MFKGNNIKRRDFVRAISLTSLTVLPAIAGLSKLFGQQGGGVADPRAFIDAAFRVMNFKNLLSLEVYFVNVSVAGTYMQKKPGARVDQSSFMIVRLPQQHIAEEYFDEQQDPKDPPPTFCKWNKNDSIYAQTVISGYSYLAFEIIWANLPSGKLALTAQSILEWDAKHYYLLVRRGLEETIFEINKSEANGIQQQLDNNYPLGYGEDAAHNHTFNRELFPKAYSSDVILYDEKKNGRSYADAAPITAIESPYGLIVSPQLPDPEYNYLFEWHFSRSTGKANYTACSKSKGEHYDEQWMARLGIRKKKKKIEGEKNPSAETETPRDELPEQKNDAGNDHMRLMLVGYSEKAIYPSTRFLPSFPNLQELVRNYISYKITARTRHLTFTPLGISTRINYLNSKYFQIAESGGKPDLYQWNHEISFGRDQEVVVTTIVMDACFGLKMLHIKSTKRQTYKGISILVYREYLQPLELEKDVTLFDSKNVNEYKDACYAYETPFKKVEFAEWDAKQILPLEQMIKGNDPDIVHAAGTALAYWPHVPGDTGRKEGREGRLKWKYKFTSHSGSVHIETKELYVVTTALTYGQNEYVNPFPDEKDTTLNVPVIKKGETIPQTFQDFDTALETATLGNDTWKQIARASGDFNLQKLDHFRLYLEEQLKQIESKLRSLAGMIEDDVMEKFIVYKQKVMSVKSDLVEKGEEIKQLVTYFIENNLLAADAALKNAIAKLKARIEELKVRFEDNFRKLVAAGDTTVTNFKRDIQADIDKVVNEAQRVVAGLADADIKKEAERRISQLQSINRFIAALTGLFNGELEREFQLFINSLPGKLKGYIASQLKKQFDSFHQCLYKIRELENSIDGKIRFHKDRINYAVHGVDEDLEKLRDRIKAKYGKEWEEKYKALKNAYAKELGKVSELQTEFVAFRNNFRQKLVNEKQKVLDFFHEYACVGKMHTAKVCVQAVNELVQKEVFVRIKYAEDYIKNQFDEFTLDVKNNVGRVFAEIKSDSKELVKATIRNIGHELGGILNPDLAADYLTFARDVRNTGDQVINSVKNEMKGAEQFIKDQVDGITNEIMGAGQQLSVELRAFRDEFKTEFEEAALGVKNQMVLIGKEAKQNLEKYKELGQMKAEEFFKGLEAKILGGIHLKDILGDGFELPKLDRKENKIVYHFITNKIVEKFDLKVVSFHNETKKAKLIVYFEKPLSGGSPVSWTSLTDFTVGIFEDRIMVEFDKLRFYSDKNKKNDISVGIKNVGFKKELAFLEALSKNIKIPGTGLSLSITPQKINVDFAYTVPGITGGAFTLNNLKFVVGVAIPLPFGPMKSIDPLIATFGINGPDDKFVVAAGIWGGRGFFVLETTPKYIRRIDMGMDYGGYLLLNLGIARGEAFLMAGIRYVFTRDEMGETGMEFYAIITCGGHVTVFGFITLSVVFVLCLKYQLYKERSSLIGTCSVTYSVKIGFFKKSFTLSFTKRLAGTDNANKTTRRKLPDANGIQYARFDDQQQDYIQYTKYEDEEYPDTIQEDPLMEKYDAIAWKRFCHAFACGPTNNSII